MTKQVVQFRDNSGWYGEDFEQACSPQWLDFWTREIERTGTTDVRIIDLSKLEAGR